MCVYTSEYVGARESWKMVSYLLKLELQLRMGHLIRVLKTVSPNLCKNSNHS